MVLKNKIVVFAQVARSIVERVNGQREVGWDTIGVWGELKGGAFGPPMVVFLSVGHMWKVLCPQVFHFGRILSVELLSFSTK